MTAGVTGRAAAPARHQFAAFFREVHGTGPFPWQEALLDHVLAGGWPALIDVPTGLGKTATLDVAVFASAMGAAQARRRVFLVVDRRLIVDQAYEHAGRIQQALATAPPGSTCHAVAARLAMPGDGGPVLDVTRMRGGTDWSWLWLERPDRHAIITGTVDQVGSRLLFRGYGVGEQLRPIDAALAGTDSLIIVDEAHLSDPFLSTLAGITQLDRPGIVRAPVVVAMSASPGEQHPATHRISAADERHPVASKRLNAPKRLHLLTIPGAKATARDNMAAAMTQQATQIGGPGRVTGVVANTVAMARAVFTRLQATVPDPAHCVLLTGRIRPVDRDYLLAEWLPRIRAGAARDPGQALYVVATQTIEVGADIDLDAMVTESAALPALIQRLGRVNRRGDQDDAPVIIVHSDALDDRVYGDARLRTWEWLKTLPGTTELKAGKHAAALKEGTGASPAQLRRLLDHLPASDLAAMRPARPYAPLVWAGTLDAWARTSPAPHPDVPVAPYLHGIEAGEPTASLVWRAGLPARRSRRLARSRRAVPAQRQRGPGTARQHHPPLARQPAKSRLRPGTADADAQLSDSESQAPGSPASEAPDASPGGTALRYGGPGGSEAISPSQLQAGDLIIVPVSRGGCDRFGWDPASPSAVTDVADLTGGSRVPEAIQAGQVAAIRIGQTLADAISCHAPGLAAPIGQLIVQVTADLDADTPDASRYQRMLRDMLATQPAAGTREPLPHERVLRRLALAGQLTRSGPLALLSDRGAGWSTDATAAGTTASPAGPQSLITHQAAVAARARQFAGNLGLPDDIIRATMLAAAHHDEGKRDPRFQLMLHGGDKWLHAAATKPLAKSGTDPASRAAFRRAWQLSGYPAGMRHEALSARIAAPLAAGGADPDLIIHLIASHHGYARPLLPPVTDPAPVPVTGPDGTVLDSAQTVDWDAPHASPACANGTAAGDSPSWRPSSASPTSGAQPAPRKAHADSSRRGTSPDRAGRARLPRRPRPAQPPQRPPPRHRPAVVHHPRDRRHPLALARPRRHRPRASRHRHRHRQRRRHPRRRSRVPAAIQQRARPDAQATRQLPGPHRRTDPPRPGRHQPLGTPPDHRPRRRQRRPRRPHPLRGTPRQANHPDLFRQVPRTRPSPARAHPRGPDRMAPRRRRHRRVPRSPRPQFPGRRPPWRPRRRTRRPRRHLARHHGPPAAAPHRRRPAPSSHPLAPHRPEARHDLAPLAPAPRHPRHPGTPRAPRPQASHPRPGHPHSRLAPLGIFTAHAAERERLPDATKFAGVLTPVNLAVIPPR